jgi:hypothetical protein
MNAGISPQQNALGAAGGRAVAGSNPVSPIEKKGPQMRAFFVV